ncbi:diphthamide biosynthesis protein [Thelephora ganbajun]|uniref:Diphthamide biosynthesis protein n=1 Tax=Thelephora ganbajun TaxID=370292 RepID=A0ACB6ZTA1_THEGA|nr:diphthamide biosynthesis protein [Thelephora ganbajun]
MTEPTTSFADSGEAVISRKIEVSPDLSASNLSADEFAHYYDIERTVDEIVKGGYKCVALQFPDGLLRDSVPIFKALRSMLGEEIHLYTLADTSYGSCCVDEVASQHVDADVVVHYGHACLSQTSQIPVIYVFGHKSIDLLNCVMELTNSVRDSLRASSAERLVLRCDVVYLHKAAEIAEQLHTSLGRPVNYREIPLKAEPLGQPLRSVAENQRLGVTDQATGDVFLYIGSESLSLTNLLVTHGSSEIHAYDPVTRQARIESHITNKLLMRRYAVLQKARDSDVFGILVGTLGVASYLPLISRIRKLLAQAQKKSYTITVGKLNPPKLANFLEIECFVLIACPENSLIDSKEFFKPIITPFELEIAISADRSWTGEYILDFGRLLEREIGPAGEVDNDEDGQRPEFSLVTGQYRKPKRFGGVASPISDEGSSIVVLRNEGTVSVVRDSAAAQFLQNRTYRGLETRVGQDMPSVLEQGRSGIARGYLDDHRPS